MGPQELAYLDLLSHAYAAQVEAAMLSESPSCEPLGIFDDPPKDVAQDAVVRDTR